MQHTVQITSQITVWPLFSHPNPHQSCILCCPKLLPQQKIFLSLSKFYEWQKPTRSWAAGITHHNPQEVGVTLKNSPSATADLSREGDISDPIKTEQRRNKLTVVSFCTYLHECRQGSGKGSLMLYQDLYQWRLLTSKWEPALTLVSACPEDGCEP